LFNYIITRNVSKSQVFIKCFLVGRDGVEPPQEYPADLQSVELATCTASP